MRLPHIWLFAAFFAYFSKVRISHIFPHILAFSSVAGARSGDWKGTVANSL